MEDRRGIVEDPAEAVAAEIPHHRAALRLGVGSGSAAPISLVQAPGLIAAMPRISAS